MCVVLIGTSQHSCLEWHNPWFLLGLHLYCPRKASVWLVWLAFRSPQSPQNGCWVVCCLHLIMGVMKILVTLSQLNSLHTPVLVHGSACAVLQIFIFYFTGWFHREVTDSQSDKKFKNLWTVTPVIPYAHTAMYIMHCSSPCNKHKHLRVYFHIRTMHSCVIISVLFITPALTS